MKLLIEDVDFADISVSVEIEEESVRRVFWNGGIHMTGRARRARLF